MAFKDDGVENCWQATHTFLFASWMHSMGRSHAPSITATSLVSNSIREWAGASGARALPCGLADRIEWKRTSLAASSGMGCVLSVLVGIQHTEGSRCVAQAVRQCGLASVVRQACVSDADEVVHAAECRAYHPAALSRRDDDMRNPSRPFHSSRKSLQPWQSWHRV